MPFLASMSLRSVHADGALLRHSAGILPCICIDILNTIPVPGRCCFCQEHIRLLTFCETIVLPVCTLYNFIHCWGWILFVVMNLRDFVHGFHGFQAVSGMKVWNEYGIESTFHKRQAVWSTYSFQDQYGVVVSKYLYSLPRPDGHFGIPSVHL